MFDYILPIYFMILYNLTGMSHLKVKKRWYMLIQLQTSPLWTAVLQTILMIKARLSESYVADIEAHKIHEPLLKCDESLWTRPVKHATRRNSWYGPLWFFDICEVLFPLVLLHNACKKSLIVKVPYMLSCLYIEKLPSEDRSSDNVLGWVYDVTSNLI